MNSSIKKELLLCPLPPRDPGCMEMLTVDGRSVGVGDTPSTSRRAQKRLFTTENGSGKRNLFRDNRISSPGGGISGDESDLGPMSPLALSDATPSSATNSPARAFDSPLVSSEPVPLVSLGSLDTALWEMRNERNEGQDRVELATSSSFSVLKMLTRSARYSQHRRLYPASPKAVSEPNRDLGEETLPTTPKHPDKSSPWNEAITETPRRRFGAEIQNEQISEFVVIAETPQKEDSPDKRLITPLGSVSKEAALPRLCHRKSLSSLASNRNSSPIDGKENMLKRTARDNAMPVSVKFFKSDECLSVPKARAALFQERKEEFKLSTKSFYSSPPQPLKTRELSMSIEKSDIRRGQKRRSLPAKGNRGRPTKRHKYGEINAGIGHGIRKPKLKRHISRAEAFKKNKDLSPVSIPTLNRQVGSSAEDISQNLDNTSADADTAIRPEGCVVPLTEQLISPEVDPAKKFFKTNRTLARNSLATVTVNDTIKLQLSNGKLKLESRQTTKRQNLCKKSKDLDLTFDANDLTVDEPTFGAPVNETSVTNILKVLEDDWADDEYDTMESLTAKHSHTLSPLKSSIIPTDVTMSPASELSSMTSVMNIEDAVGLASKADCVSNNSSDIDRSGGAKFYPLFNKKFPGNNSVTGIPKKVGRGARTAWQLPTKTRTKDDRQYQLDVGQKQFGATQCSQCGVIYQIGDPDDERSHRNYHDSIRILKFSGWKQERIVSTDPYTASRIILVEPGDPKHWWKKISDILTVVDRDLGLAESKPSDYHNDKIYLYIREKEIIGVLVAEHVTAAYRMIPDLIDINCCSLESSVVKCGVKVVWTTMSRRRQGVATKLLDILRTNFYFGYILTVDDIAFSIPTPGGKAFAEKYTNTRSFKVYN